MAGEGFIAHMIASLRANNRRTKRVAFEKGTSYYSATTKKEEFDFPEATPELLQRIRERLQKEQKHHLIKWVLTSTLFFLMVIGFFIYITLKS